MRPKTVAAAAAVGVLLLGALAGAAGPTYAGLPVVNVQINGQPLTSDVPGVVLDGRTLLPVRAVAEAIGADVQWDPATSTVLLSTGQLHAHLARLQREAGANQLRLVDLQTQYEALEATRANLQFQYERLQADAADLKDRAAQAQQLEFEVQRLQAELAALQARSPKVGDVPKRVEIPPRTPVPTAPWRLTCRVALHADSPVADVSIQVENPGKTLSGLTLQPLPRGTGVVDYVTNLRVSAGALESYRWNLRGVAESILSYTVKLNIPDGRGAYWAHASDKWILTATRDICITIGSSIPEARPEQVTLEVQAPPGWEVFTPYPQIGEGRYDATGERVAPTALLVAAPQGSARTARRQAGDTEILTVALPGARHSAEDPADLLAKLVPLFSGIGGWGPERLMAVVGPPPLDPYWGESAGPSLWVSDRFGVDGRGDSGMYGLELFRLFQHYRADEDRWVARGIASYYQYQGLLRAGTMSIEEFWTTLTVAAPARVPPNVTVARDPTYRGALVAFALDILIRQDSGGQYSLDDVVRYLNAAYEGQEVSAGTLATVTTVFTGRSYSDFFAKYVQGTELPAAIWQTASPDLFTP